MPVTGIHLIVSCPRHPHRSAAASAGHARVAGVVRPGREGLAGAAGLPAPRRSRGGMGAARVRQLVQRTGVAGQAAAGQVVSAPALSLSGGALTVSARALSLSRGGTHRAPACAQRERACAQPEPRCAHRERGCAQREPRCAHRESTCAQPERMPAHRERTRAQPERRTGFTGVLSDEEPNNAVRRPSPRQPRSPRPAGRLWRTPHQGRRCLPLHDLRHSQCAPVTSFDWKRGRATQLHNALDSSSGIQSHHA